MFLLDRRAEGRSTNGLLSKVLHGKYPSTPITRTAQKQGITLFHCLRKMCMHKVRICELQMLMRLDFSSNFGPPLDPTGANEMPPHPPKTVHATSREHPENTQDNFVLPRVVGDSICDHLEVIGVKGWIGLGPNGDSIVEGIRIHLGHISESPTHNIQQNKKQ